MTRKRVPPPKPPTFDDEPTNETPLPSPDSFAKAALDEPPFEGRVEVLPGFRSASLPVEVSSVVIGEADRIRDAAAALVDEYVARCVSGESVGLPELRELRKRVAGL